MTTAPGKIRLQITIPQELKDHLDEMGRAAGLNCREVASIYLAEGAARTRAETSLSGARCTAKQEPIARSTARRRLPESAAPEVSEEDPSAADILALMDPAVVQELRDEGWTDEQIKEVLEGDDDDE